MNSIYRQLGFLAIAISLLTATDAWAAIRTWDGGAGNNTWSSVNNWNPDGFATTDDLTVNTTVVLAGGSGAVTVSGPGVVTIGPSGDLDITNTGDLRLYTNSTLNIQGILRRTDGNWLRFGDAGSLNSTINHSGTLQSNAPVQIAFNQYSGSGQSTYNMTGGILNAPSMTLGWSYSTNTGSMTGTFSQSGNADVNIGGDIQLGQTATLNTVSGTGIGYYNMAGGTLDAAAIKIGYWLDAVNSGGPSIGVFTQTGGTIGGTARPNIVLAVGAPSTGTYVMRGGTLRARDLTDSGVGAASILKVQGGLGTIDVSTAFSFTAPSGSSVIPQVGNTGLTTINVSGSGTANLGANTSLVPGVFGGAALNPSSTFTVLQLASGSITGSFVPDAQAALLWNVSSTSNSVTISLAPTAEKAQLVLGQAVTGLSDAYGWVDVLQGSYGPSTFGLQLQLGGSGSVADLATWMSTTSGAGLDATADSATSSIILKNLTTPAGAQSYFMWDLREFNSTYGASFFVANLYTIPEPSTLALAGIGLIGLALARRRRPGTGPA
jgi:hypothetical protein